MPSKIVSTLLEILVTILVGRSGIAVQIPFQPFLRFWLEYMDEILEMAGEVVFQPFLRF
ncbi:MAG: hypothetical protein ACO2PN_29665 [Pyrobaculum sp.]